MALNLFGTQATLTTHASDGYRFIFTDIVNEILRSEVKIVLRGKI